jgi:glyoxylate reductase
MARVFVTRQIPEAGLARLRSAGHEVAVGASDRSLTRDELVAALTTGRYDAVLCLLTDQIDDAVLEAAGPQCKIFANYAVGFDNIELTAAAARGIMVANTPGVLSETVAEHAVALMLAIAHRIPEADRFTRAGKYRGWEPMLLLGQDMSGKTLGVVGLGRIGTLVAERCARGFGMPVVYYDPNPQPALEQAIGAKRLDLDELLRAADFVSIHVPLLPATKHLIDAAHLKLMKPSAYLVNTSRGPVVDEVALAEALRTGVVRGAALDVFEFEPQVTPALLQLDNAILTPHIASATEATRSRMAELAADNVIAALSGQMPPNLVAARRGR